MAIRVKEFVIQAKIDGDQPIQREVKESQSADGSQDIKKEIVDECIDKVLQHLKDQEER